MYRIRRYYLYSAVILSFLAVTSFNPLPRHGMFNYPTDPAFLDSSSAWVDSVFNSLSLDEKIGQMIMVAAYSNRGADHQDEILQLIEKYQVGGVVFFQGGPVRQAKMTNGFK